jgi:predicted Zn-dependent protease
MELDAAAVARWLEPLAKRPEEIAEVFTERRRDITVTWRDGEIREARGSLSEGLSARWKGVSGQRLAFVSRCDEEAARQAVRAVQKEMGLSRLPVKPSRVREESAGPVWLDADRWIKRLSALFARHAPRHRFRWTLSDVARQVIPARGAACAFARRLMSVHGTLTAASRRGDETRDFAFHAPVGESTAEELRGTLTRAGQPRDTATPCGEGETDVVLAAGCAAVLFHEILSHPLEAGAESPLSGLEQARLAPAEVEVRDDATRLDLFGGYERDDEGGVPRAVKLLDAGRLSGRLTDRAHASAGATSNGHARRAGPQDPPLPRGSNVLVAPGHSAADEILRRLSSGLWIEQIDGGSVELASGRFRLNFPRARRVRRGRMADECGAGVLSGEILPVLRSIDPGIGREVRAYRALAWCARGGQVVPVQGAAPDVLVRGFSVRPVS